MSGSNYANRKNYLRSRSDLPRPARPPLLRLTTISYENDYKLGNTDDKVVGSQGENPTSMGEPVWPRRHTRAVQSTHKPAHHHGTIEDQCGQPYLQSWDATISFIWRPTFSAAPAYNRPAGRAPSPYWAADHRTQYLKGSGPLVHA